MTASDPNPAAADRERILDRVADAMEVLDRDGEAGLERFCAGLGADRDAVLRRLKTLRSVGLMQEARSAAPEVPDQVGDFRLLERIGAGGMGVVHRARQLSLDRDAAVKLIRPDQLLFPGVRERFRRETAIVARLQHEGIVRLFGFGEDHGVPWFAMEYVDGVSLAEVLQGGQGKVPRELTGADFAQAVGATDTTLELFAGSWQDACLRVIERAALAVAAAHAEGVLHRDLKPSNVMVTPAGRVVLLDFGLAWSNVGDRLTRSGAPLGTVNYMAPEQLAGAAAMLDERVDVYALGVVLRELLTLRPAFVGSSFDAVAERVRAGLPAPFARDRSAASRDAEIVCAMAMDRDRARRHPGAKTLARDVRCVVERRPILATPPSLGLRLRRFAERHRALTAAAAVAAFAVVATPLVIAWRERSLRIQLEATNSALAQQVARADSNLGVAAEAMNRTLARFDAEQITGIPDLKPFADAVLVDTDAFLDALLAINPADPAARLRLAETLRRAGHLRWQFFDLPRTATVFHRVLELLDGCAGDPDTIDEIFVDVRLALLYVERSELAAMAEAYRAIVDRVRRRGPWSDRTPLLQHHVARALVRAANLAIRRKEFAEAATWIADARTVLDRLTTAHPTIVHLLEAAKCFAAAADLCEQQGDGEGTKRHVAECAAVTQRILAMPPQGDGDRLALTAWLPAWMFTLIRRGDHAAVVSLAEANGRLHAWFVERAPSRLQHRREWAENAQRLANSLVETGRVARAVEVLREVCRTLEPALHLWPKEGPLWRAFVTSQWQIVELLLRDGDTQALGAEAATLRTVTERAIAAAPESALATSACCSARMLLARLALRTRDHETAVAAIESAVQLRTLADSQATTARIRLGSDLELRLLHAEVLLQAERPDAAFTVLDELGKRLPRDLLQQVPALGRHADAPRAQALLARARDAR